MGDQPDTEQQQVIEAAEAQALILYAGPGSGKNRTLIGRISYLLHRGSARPEEIVAVTFTRKAAGELRRRLGETLGDRGGADVLAGTFHSLAHHILRQHAAAVGVDPHFTICDEQMQEAMMRRALSLAGTSHYAGQQVVRDLLDAVSHCKRERHDPAECPGNHSSTPGGSFASPVPPRVAEAYRLLLQQHGMLDYSDLILYATRALSDPVIGGVWREEHPWLFVDEFHDIDQAQYHFIRRLAPPGTSQVMVVLDEEQRIYGWRGAEGTIVEQFKQEYHPRQYSLRNNYRSGARIVVACDSLLQSVGIGRFSRPAARKESRVFHRWSGSEAEEGAWLAGEIERLLCQEGYQPAEVALLYRTHRVGERLEQVLADHGFALDRTRHRSFFQRPEVQELRRYLYAAITLADEFVTSTLNFPRTVADELTMIQLRRAAEKRGVTLTALMRSVESVQEIGPATRVQVARFVEMVQEELSPFVHEPPRAFNDRLFRVLDRRRSPYPQEALPGLRRFAARCDLQQEAETLSGAIRRGHPVELKVDGSLDGWCAAAIVAGVLHRYFALAPAISLSPVSPATAALRIDAGSPYAEPIALAACDAGTTWRPATLAAWQLAASLLLCFERAPDGIVAFDLETSGLDPRADSVVELAAQRLAGFRPAGEGFNQRVNPGRAISRRASMIHGIVWGDVCHERPWEQVLPEYLAYLGESILLGHNPGEFDLPFLNALAERAGLPPVRNPCVDTLALARRLLPELREYSLQALVEQLGLPGTIFHEAAADVDHTVDLFEVLWEEHRLDQRLHVLAGYLPLVAAVLARGKHERGENGVLVTAGCQLLRRDPAAGTARQCLRVTPSLVAGEVQEEMERLGRRTLAPTPDDTRWQALREEWERYIDHFAREGKDTSIDSFLSYTALIHRDPDLVAEGERLQMMTIHAAKGKEFRAVFLVGMEHGVLPSFLSTTPEALAEERRICYVGMSRAQERLYLLGCQRSDRARCPSAFLRALMPRSIPL